MRPAPFIPRNGHTLVVCIVARISGCQNQKELSLDDQVDHGKEVVAEEYEGPVEYHTICTKGKGERLDRPELAQIEAAYRSRQFDLFVIEDLGRLVRGAEASRLLGVGVDHGTHTLVPNDCIDTRDETWEQDALEACSEHVGHNAHTSRRLKKKLMNRFMKFGGATALPIYGYIVPENAKTYDDWQRDPAATPHILEGARRLRESRNYSAVADWFNSQRIAVGPYVRRAQWDGAMIRRFFENPILKGLPQRGKKHTVKRHEVGRRVSELNPKGPVFYDAPHLAHLDAGEFDALNAELRAKNAKNGRKPANGFDPLFGVPRRRTRFPGQHARCWYCGREYVWGGNGNPDSLMCAGAREWTCWNSIAINGPLASKKLVAVICEELCRLDDFQEQFAGMLQTANRELINGSAADWNQLLRDEALVLVQKEKIQASIAAYGPQPVIREMLQNLESTERALLIRRTALERMHSERGVFPASTIDLRKSLEEKFAELAINSHAFNDFMRQLVPEFYVHLVRLCDGGHLLPRAKVKLNLAGTFPDVNFVPGLRDLVTRELTLDLFTPPQRELIRPEVVRLTSANFTQRGMRNELPGHPTQPAVSKAILLHRKMLSLGLDSPYVTVFDPPADYTKLRRYEHSRYEFKKLDGYERPAR